MDHAKSAEPADNVVVAIIDFFQDRAAFTMWSRLFNPEQPSYNHPGPNTAGPLYFAALKGLNVTARNLLDKGADVNTQGGLYGSALQAASSGGHKGVVQMLLAKGADVNAQGGEYGSAQYVASLEATRRLSSAC